MERVSDELAVFVEAAQARFVFDGEYRLVLLREMEKR